MKIRPSSCTEGSDCLGSHRISFDLLINSISSGLSYYVVPRVLLLNQYALQKAAEITTNTGAQAYPCVMLSNKVKSLLTVFLAVSVRVWCQQVNNQSVSQTIITQCTTQLLQYFKDTCPVEGTGNQTEASLSRGLSSLLGECTKAVPRRVNRSAAVGSNDVTGHTC